MLLLFYFNKAWYWKTFWSTIKTGESMCVNIKQLFPSLFLELFHVALICDCSWRGKDLHWDGTNVLRIIFQENYKASEEGHAFEIYQQILFKRWLLLFFLLSILYIFCQALIFFLCVFFLLFLSFKSITTRKLDDAILLLGLHVHTYFMKVLLINALS